MGTVTGHFVFCELDVGHFVFCELDVGHFVFCELDVGHFVFCELDVGHFLPYLLPPKRNLSAYHHFYISLALCPTSGTSVSALTDVFAGCYLINSGR
jgi:hypothetical protein